MREQARVGVLFDSARALKRAASYLEGFAVADACATIDTCNTSVLREAQKHRMARAQTDIDSAIAAISAYTRGNKTMST